ncbi:MAG: hypothetical protein K2N94_06835, partial [Lachnospiraceae bacterium]|nr:hypothetical protein [Lachnospiraceae bacterium]
QLCIRARAGENYLSREEKARLWGREEEKRRPELPKPDETRKAGAKETSRTESEIVVRPDGSRVLLVTVRQGGAVVRAMSLKLSEPTQMQNDSSEEKTEEARKGADNRGGEGPEAAGTKGMPRGMKVPEAAGTERMPGETKAREAAGAEGMPGGTKVPEAAGTERMSGGMRALEAAGTGITEAGGEDA